MGETFDAPITAVEVGWDDPSLQRILQGEAVPEPAAEQGGPYDAELANAYLKVLERREQYGEYLNLAKQAAVIAFKEASGLDNYLKVQELAGYDWPAKRTELLQHLRRTDLYIQTDSKVDVFLHEDLFDDAIAAVEKYAYYDTLARVMDAVIEHRPEWVIKNARKQAEDIIDPGKSEFYNKAMEWLKRARAAYQAAGREQEWRDYVGEIRTIHGRKYKLMGLMKDL